MKIWKRNAVVATVLLFVCVGIYLNWSYNRNEAVPDLTDQLDAGKILGEAALVVNDEIPQSEYVSSELESVATVSSAGSEYFDSVRLSRQAARDSALDLLQEAAAYASDTTGEEVSSASSELETMVRTALSEAQIEGLIISKGYSDCVAFMNDDGISIAVAAPDDGLTETDVAKIADIVLEQSEYTMAGIKIIEVR